MAKKKTVKKTGKKTVKKVSKKQVKKVAKRMPIKKKRSQSTKPIQKKNIAGPIKGGPVSAEVEPIAPSAASVCKYQVQQVIPIGCEELQVGDMVCFPCPESGKCPAMIGWIQIKGKNCKFTVHQFGEDCVRNTTDCIKIFRIV